MLTGRKPFESDYEQALVYSILNEEPKPIRDIRRDVPEALEKVGQRGMAKEMGERYQSSTELIADLELSESGSRLSRGTRRLKKRKRRVLLLVSVAVVSIGSAIALFFSGHKGLKTNPDSTTRILRTYSFLADAVRGVDPPSSATGISWDGNWISYSVPDDSGRWSLNFANVSWDEPRKIPIPVSPIYGGVKISPAGDLIALSWSAASGRCLGIISTRGGGMQDSRRFHRRWGGWTPDGRRLGYLRYHQKPGGLPIPQIQMVIPRCAVLTFGALRRTLFVLSHIGLYPHSSGRSDQSRVPINKSFQSLRSTAC
jgi:hypothetical protein